MVMKDRYRLNMPLCGKASAWKAPGYEPGSREHKTRYWRIDGKDYPSTAGFLPFREGRERESLDVSANCVSGSPRKPVRFVPGKHRVSIVFKDIDVIDPADPGHPKHYPELSTNAVEFEVVDKLPEGMLKAEYRDGWEELLKGNLELAFTDTAFGISASESDDTPPLVRIRLGTVPFDVAFAVEARPEGEDWQKVGREDQLR